MGGDGGVGGGEGGGGLGGEEGGATGGGVSGGACGGRGGRRGGCGAHGPPSGYGHAGWLCEAGPAGQMAEKGAERGMGSHAPAGCAKTSGG